MKHSGLTQFHAVAGLHVALEFALYHHGLGLNRGLDLAVGTDRQTIAFERDSSLDLTIHVKVLAAGQLAFNDYRFAYLRQICRQRSTHECSPQGAGCRPTKRKLFGSKVLGLAASFDYTQQANCAASGGGNRYLLRSLHKTLLQHG